MRPILRPNEPRSPLPVACRMLGHKHRRLPARAHTPTYAAYPFDEHFAEYACVRSGCDDEVLELVAAPTPIRGIA